MGIENLRKHERYATDVRVQFQIPYDFRTEVNFTMARESSSQKFIGFSKNICTYGLCFESAKEVRPDDHLWLELHLPDSKEVIYMQGVARWSKPAASPEGGFRNYQTGVEVRVVDGVDVEKTVYFDNKYGVYWSELLERVLGAFSKMHQHSSILTVARGVLKDRDGRYLMLKRSVRSRSWPLKWEFPGGKVDPKEQVTSALCREFIEETGLTVNPLRRFMEFTYERAEGAVEYKIFFVEMVSGVPAISDEHEAMGWFTAAELRVLDVSPSLTDVVHRLVEM
jgi:8-oxo-dGTP diphosphatase